jgi:hypothetical protein
LKGLRSRWQSVTGRVAATHLPRHLLFAMIAYRIQADIMGDLDADTVRHLKKIGLARSNVEAIPLTNAFERRRRELLLGTVLQREWNGPEPSGDGCRERILLGRPELRQLV